MPRVKIAPQLTRFFPGLAGLVEVEAASVAEVVRAVDALAPGLADYVVDERGALRRHVNLFIGPEMVVDRAGLSDKVAASQTVTIAQALSGG